MKRSTSRRIDRRHRRHIDKAMRITRANLDQLNELLATLERPQPTEPDDHESGFFDRLA
jgi:hypothetical protein